MIIGRSKVAFSSFNHYERPFTKEFLKKYPNITSCLWTAVFRISRSPCTTLRRRFDVYDNKRENWKQK